MMRTAESLAQDVHIKKACEVLGIPRASYYYYQKCKKDFSRERVSSVPPLALSDQEQQAVLDILHSERFVDKAPREIYATLLDEGIYRCSIRTMYRILKKHGELRERRNQLLRPNYQKPELLATASNQIWSWDITKLKGPAKGPISTCMSFLISSAVTWLAGWLHIGNRQFWHNVSSLIPVKNRLSNQNT